MVETGDTAPDFTLMKAGGDSKYDIETFRLSDALDEGPVVLAFYPAAFTGGCSDEMNAFQTQLQAFEDVGTAVYGISVDLAPSQNVWIEQEELDFPMLSDDRHAVIREYDVVREGVFGGLETAKRSIFVVDSDGIVRWKWVQDGDLPDFSELVNVVLGVVTDLGAE